MGMLFPLGLARVEASDARLIPWAWAINGCASVTGAVLATLLAIHVGFTAVVVAALVVYAVAAAARPPRALLPGRSVSDSSPTLMLAACGGSVLAVHGPIDPDHVPS